MTVKMKIFPLKPERSEEISAFMESVKVIEQGIITDGTGNVGILYKDRSETGMATPELVTSASGELALAQKQFVKQEGLVRGYEAMIEVANKEQEEEEIKRKEFEDRIALNRESYGAEAIVKTYLAKKAEVASAESRYKQVTKSEKPDMLKHIKELNDAIAEITPEYERLTKAMEDEEKALTNQMALHKLNVANLQGKIKQNIGFKEDAIDAREHSRVFIISTKKLIQELEAGEVAGVK